jgi:hypothetical protein
MRKPSPLVPPRRALSNKSGDNHPVHLHRHTFEITKVGDRGPPA